MRNGFNQFSVPYMNELTANQYNAASVFGGNMPVGFVNYSMDIINGFFQGQSAPQTGRSEDFESVIINGKRVLRRKVTELGTIIGLPQTPSTPPINGNTNCPPGEKEYFDIFGIKRCGKPMTSDGKGTIGDDPTGSGKKAEEILTNPIGSLTDLSGKTVVILVGLVLLVAAVVSLR